MASRVVDIKASSPSAEEIRSIYQELSRRKLRSMDKVLQKVAQETQKDYIDRKMKIEANPDEIEAGILERENKPLKRKFHHKASDFEIFKVPKIKELYDHNGFLISKSGYKIDYYVPQDETKDGNIQNNSKSSSRKSIKPPSKPLIRRHTTIKSFRTKILGLDPY